MTSPNIIQLADEPSGTLRGKAAVGTYWAKALQLIPDLHFELITTLFGVNSITLYYRGAQGRLAAEVFHFNQEQKVTQAFAPIPDTKAFQSSAVPAVQCREQMPRIV